MMRRSARKNLKISINHIVMPINFRTVRLADGIKRLVHDFST